MTTFPCLFAGVDYARCLLQVAARLAVVLAAFALLAGLSPALAQPSGRAGAPRQAVSVQLAWKYQFEFAAFIAAQEKAYYHEAGLDVSLREWSPDVDVVKEVAQGRADFGTLDSRLIVERANGRPVIAVAALLQHSRVGLLARRQAGIVSAGDLAGSRVGSNRATEDEILAFLAASALPPGSFEHLPAIADARRALSTGQVDAVGVFIGDELVREFVDSGDYLLLSPRSAAVDFYGMLLFTSEGFLQARPDTVRAFRAATLKGLDYALEHPEELVDLILARYNTQNKSREQLLFEAQQIGDLARAAGVGSGAMSIGRWQHVVDVYTTQGQLKPGTDLLGFVYDPDAGGLGPFIPWMLGGAALGVLLVVWGARKFLAPKS
ncbi:MAG: putative thiamine biosynthesis protein [Candidatus Accumulibacter appositus]|uniref:Thiamine pyrimidine synthase n=1 Tax=Candidatus Accumulibacter appositus TaxID=1454003 RepID=A0A011NV25_9PROT|nr:ABC transporter substrate-binding protein [Accumulibacter sp.]EXI79216.1 MAG: putative thiamine biosynthesis protein [Candidatus Accumulibacter appositus]HRF04254.1 ABC transporter substrate-binding protein [Accumulibacter sp.]